MDHFKYKLDSLKSEKNNAKNEKLQLKFWLIFDCYLLLVFEWRYFDFILEVNLIRREDEGDILECAIRWCDMWYNLSFFVKRLVPWEIVLLISWKLCFFFIIAIAHYRESVRHVVHHWRPIEVHLSLWCILQGNKQIVQFKFDFLREILHQERTFFRGEFLNHNEDIRIVRSDISAHEQQIHLLILVPA